PLTDAADLPLAGRQAQLLTCETECMEFMGRGDTAEVPNRRAESAHRHSIRRRSNSRGLEQTIRALLARPRHVQDRMPHRHPSHPKSRSIPPKSRSEAVSAASSASSASRSHIHSLIWEECSLTWEGGRAAHGRGAARMLGYGATRPPAWKAAWVSGMSSAQKDSI